MRRHPQPRPEPAPRRVALGSEFRLGVNLPWLDYGLDFGANAWQPDGGLAARPSLERLRRALARSAEQGAALVRWFVLCDGRAGLRSDADGDPTALDSHVLTDLDSALGLLRESGLQAIFVLFDYLWFRRRERQGNVSLFGRRGAVADPARRGRLLERVVRPLLERYGDAREIAAWDLLNEPEWATLGLGGRDRRAALTRSGMERFLAELADAVRESTRHPATVGLASAAGLPLVRSLGLDFYQVHWYDWAERRSPLDTPVAALGLDRPVVLGEFPTRRSAKGASEIIESARRNGYAAALAWSALAADAASDPDAWGAALQRLALARGGGERA